MLERYLIVWLSLTSLAAYAWPAWFGDRFDPFVASGKYLWMIIAVTMLAVGYMLPRDEVRQVARRWPAVFSGTAVQYITMPVLAFLVGKLFGLDSAGMIGITIVGCVPGAMASNVLTLNARGNTSYSVSLTTTATLLSPLIVPLVLGWALGKKYPIDSGAMALNLLLTVAGPVVAGHLLNLASERWEAKGRPIAATVANLTILWIIAVVVGRSREQLVGSAMSIIPPLLALNLAGYCVGYWSGALIRLPEGMRRALTMEVGMQNAGLGTVAALKMFPDRPSVAILPAAYTFGCMFTGTILARYWVIRDVRREGASGDAEQDK